MQWIFVQAAGERINIGIVQLLQVLVDMLLRGLELRFLFWGERAHTARPLIGYLTLSENVLNLRPELTVLLDPLFSIVIRHPLLADLFILKVLLELLHPVNWHRLSTRLQYACRAGQQLARHALAGEKSASHSRDIRDTLEDVSPLRLILLLHGGRFPKGFSGSDRPS